MKYTFVSVTDALKSLVQMTPREHVKHAITATNYVKEQFGALEEKATKYAQDLEVTLEELNALKDRTIDAVAKSSLMDVKVADIPDTVISTVVNEAATFFEPAKPVATQDIDPGFGVDVLKPSQPLTSPLEMYEAVPTAKLHGSSKPIDSDFGDLFKDLPKSPKKPRKSKDADAS